MKYLKTIFILLVLVGTHSILAVNYGERKILDFAKNHKSLNKTSENLNIHLFPHSHTDVILYFYIIDNW